MIQKTAITMLTALFICMLNNAQGDRLIREFEVNKKYISLPVNRDTHRERLEFKSRELETYFDIRLANDSVDYWTFIDVQKFKGSKVILSAEKSDYLKKAFELIVLSDEIKTDVPIYEEKLRQQLHFSSKRGWNNDPNGLVYYDGAYHLYYQHNPYGWNWGNMHWGHAVSTDLIHWKELADALFPDELGTMFSGSAVVDFNNTAGFQKDQEKVIVAVYTANGEAGQQQCIAYSNDRGRTFTKYDKNPVLPAIERFESAHERDPKVFWYKPGNNWVMVLFEGMGNSIYTSDNLKEWKYESHIKGFWECPELFELPVGGDENNKKWVMYGASGTYMIGNFNGRKFSPETNKLKYCTGSIYAAQTYNNAPGKKRIQIGWGTIASPGMPFNQMMTFPSAFSLENTRQGVRLHINPIAEISALYSKSHSFQNITIGEDEINERIKHIKSNQLHIKVSFKPINSIKFGLNINGYDLTYDLNRNKLNDEFVPVVDERLKLEIIVDRNSLEIYANDGQFLVITPYNSTDKELELSFSGSGSFKTLIENLEIHELNSIWE